MRAVVVNIAGKRGVIKGSRALWTLFGCAVVLQVDLVTAACCQVSRHA